MKCNQDHLDDISMGFIMLFFLNIIFYITHIFPLFVYFMCSLQECISDYREVLLSGKMNVTTEVIPGTGGLRPVLSPDCWPTFTEMVCRIYIHVVY